MSKLRAPQVRHRPVLGEQRRGNSRATVFGVDARRFLAREWFAREKRQTGASSAFFIELLSIFAKTITFFGRIGSIGSIGCAGLPNCAKRKVA
jgi:hypothetical protein